MRYRALTASGDYSFGRGLANFLTNSPAAVAQAILTRLALWEGEWFLDQTEGTPYAQQILGYGTNSIYDIAIQARILGTQGVTKILTYASSRDPIARKLTVTASVLTQYSATPITINTPV